MHYLLDDYLGSVFASNSKLFHFEVFQLVLVVLVLMLDLLVALQMLALVHLALGWMTSNQQTSIVDR